MYAKEDMKGINSKEYIQYLKEFIKDTKHKFIPQLSTQEEDKEEQDDLFQSCLEKIEKQLESRNLESSKVDDSLQHHGFNSGPRNYFIQNIDMRNLYGKDPITWIFHMGQFLVYTKCPLCQR